MSLTDPGPPITKESDLYEVYCLRAKLSNFLILKKFLRFGNLHLANVLINVQVF